MTERLYLYLTAGRAYLRRQTGRPWDRRVELLDTMEWDAQDPATLNLSLQYSGWTRVRLHVYVGASLCKLMAIEVPGSVQGPAEAQAVALAMMEHELGISAADWTCALDRPVTEAKSVACAIRCELLAHLNAIAKEKGWRLASMRPLVSGLWNAAQLEPWQGDRPRALLAIEEDALSVIVATGQRIDSVFSLPHRGEAGLVERELQRLRYSSGAGEAVDVRLALVGSRSNMADGMVRHALKIAPNRTSYFADYGDMFFGTAMEVSS